MIEDRVASETDVVTKLSRESVAATVARLTGMITAKGMRPHQHDHRERDEAVRRDRPGGSFWAGCAT